MTDVLIPSVNALIIHDSDGERLFAKYYDSRNKAQQKDFESLLYKKTKSITAKSEAEVLLLENEIVIFKSGSDCRFYVSGLIDENELILGAVLDTVYDAINTLMKNQVDKRTMLDNLELILLTIDEMLDNGNIMELDSTSIVNRVLMRGAEPNNHAQNTQAVGDLSLSQAFGLARDQFFKTLAGGRGNDSY